MASPSPSVPPPAVGVDVASASRLDAALRRRPALAQRLFSERERADCADRPDRLAARFAAKEAVRKLAGGRGEPLPGWREVEVVRAPDGVPSVLVRGRPAAVALSLAHEGDIAVAVVVGAGAGAVVDLPAGLRLPERPADGHKGTFGTVTVVAGAHGFTGAAYLAAMGAARGGAGLVRLCVPAALHPPMAVKCTEVMAHGLADGGRGVIGDEAVRVLEAEHIPHSDALVVGPGVGRDPATAEALCGLIERLAVPSVVDADGLNIAAERSLRWPRGDGDAPRVVLTPHPAEMGRLAGLSTREVQADRAGVATAYARRHGVVVVLKGAETVIAAPDGRLHIDAHHLVALATGGTGDVLAGVIGAMLGAGLTPFDAAVAGVSIHAEAGVAVQRERGRAGALAGDLLEALPAAQERLRRALELGR